MAKPPKKYLNASGERFLFTWYVSDKMRYLSMLQVKACWPELGETDVMINAQDAQGRVLQFSVGRRVQVLQTRVVIRDLNSKQGRALISSHSSYFNCSACPPSCVNLNPDLSATTFVGAELTKAGAENGSIVAFSKTSEGTYHFEVDTPEAKAFYDAFRPAYLLNRDSAASLATDPSGMKQQKSKMPTKKRGPGRKKKRKEEEESGMSTDDDFLDDDDLIMPQAKRLYTKGAHITADSTRQRAGKRNIHGSPIGGLDTFIQAPMRRLPEEAPLGLESFGSEVRAAHGVAAGGTGERGATGAISAAGADAADVSRAIYRAAVNSARKRMQQRANTIGKEKGILNLPQRALTACVAFEKFCLEPNAGLNAEERMAVCIEYDTVLRLLYPDLILDPHFMYTKAMEVFEGTEDLQLLRCMQRRFIIWRQGGNDEGDEKKGGADGTGTGAASLDHRPGSGSGQGDAAGKVEPKPLSPIIQRAKSLFAGAVGALTGQGSGSIVHKEKVPASLWVDGLAHIWGEFSHRLRGMSYGGIDLQSTENRVSCALTDTLWENGRLDRCPVPASVKVLAAVDESQHGRRPGLLYLTDGSMPDYEARSYPRAAPGMPCSVDAASNAMFPHAMRSSRASNLFHFLKNESTGTGTFTLFLPVGGGCNLTAFHYETKRRRSYNCGSGDYIVQPLAVADNVRTLMRVHAAVTGQHTRHGQLLPLECYLEEGTTMVTHVRRTGEAPTLCELCEQSMHAFLSFADATSVPRPLKVSCNDFDLLWEVNSAYFLELVAAAYNAAGCMPEEGMPPDGADTWIQSSYLLSEPRTLAALEHHGPARPWLCEATLRCQGASSAGINGDASSLKEDLERHSEDGKQGNGEEVEAVVDDSELHWGMDVVVVRTVEKLLDILHGVLTQDNVAPWAGEVPSLKHAGEAVRNLVPVLAHMQSRAASETNNPSSTSDGCGGSAWPLDCHFSREYMAQLLKAVKLALEARKVSYVESVHCSPRPMGGSGCGKKSKKHPGGVSLGALQDRRPSELRAMWIESLHNEWMAVSARPVDLRKVADARKERACVEKAWDTACCSLVEERREDWV